MTFILPCGERMLEGVICLGRVSFPPFFGTETSFELVAPSMTWQTHPLSEKRGRCCGLHAFLRFIATHGSPLASRMAQAINENVDSYPAPRQFAIKRGTLVRSKKSTRTSSTRHRCGLRWHTNEYEWVGVNELDMTRKGVFSFNAVT